MRRFAWVPFSVALLAFALPFAVVSCDGSRVEASGADLVLRTPPETEVPRSGGVELGELVVAYGGGLATAAFLAFAIGLLAAVRGWTGGWATLAGLVGVAALVFLKTRGNGSGPEGIADVDARLGGILAGIAGAVGAVIAAAQWLSGDRRPEVRPVLPVAAMALLLFGYLYPSDRTELISYAYADTLNLRRPWEGLFWVLPLVVGTLLLTRRKDLPRATAAFSVGVLAVVGADAGDEILRLWREDALRPGVAPVAFLAGMVAAGLWAVGSEWRRLRRPALAPLGLGVALALVAWVAGPAGP